MKNIKLYKSFKTSRINSSCEEEMDYLQSNFHLDLIQTSKESIEKGSPKWDISHPKKGDIYFTNLNKTGEIYFVYRRGTGTTQLVATYFKDDIDDTNCYLIDLDNNIASGLVEIKELIDNRV
jgi:hypothetical protein